MASGDTLIVFKPRDAEFPTSNFPTLDTRNNHPCLDFDASTDETCYFSAVMPRNYGGGGLTIYVTGSWSSDTNNTHTTQIDIAFERIGDGQQDLDADGFAQPNPCDLSVPSTSGLTDVGSVAFTDGADMDNVAAGELFRLEVMCDVSAGDHTGDFELHSIEIKET